MSYKPQLKLKRPDLLLNKVFINGEFKPSNKTFKVFDPASSALITEVSDGTAQDTKQAIEAAHNAFLTFKETTARERSDLLRNWASLVRANFDDLAQIVSFENGKPIAEATGEVLATASTFEWFSELAPHFNGQVIPSQNKNVRIHSYRQPVGVCGVITPWNFPSLMLARKAGAAVGAGCTVVVKPAQETPLSCLSLLALGLEAGIPAGVLNAVPTQTHTKDVGLELTKNPKVKKITFTGSTPIGKLLMEQSSSSVKKVSFELGGNAPFIVFDDADIDLAVKGAMASKFRGSGQTCVCANRFFVQEKVYDEFVEKFGLAIKELKPGHALNNSTQGPLINQRSMDKVREHVADAVKNGRLVTGGKELKELGPLFYEPTLVADLDPTVNLVFKDETFGPLAAVAKFTTDDEVVQMANNNEAGLAAYFYTSSVKRANFVSEKLETGMVGINTGIITEVALPFGGVKESGFGRENSNFGFDDYTVIKSVVTNLE